MIQIDLNMFEQATLVFALKDFNFRFVWNFWAELSTLLQLI